VGVRLLLCRYHGCELEIPVCPTYCFLNPDYTVFDFGCMAFAQLGLAFACIAKQLHWQDSNLAPQALSVKRGSGGVISFISKPARIDSYRGLPWCHAIAPLVH
jgi:hypothetical protein